MAPEVVSTALRAVRTRFWVPLLVPFVSKVHEASQWARNFALCACRRGFQQPRLKADIIRVRNTVRFRTPVPFISDVALESSG